MEGLSSIGVDYLNEVLGRHGIPISRRVVIEELAQIRASGYDPEVVRRVLESRPEPCGAQGRATPVCQLSQALAELELLLGKMEGLAGPT